jgi:formylmethanofuran dehydrogenase subunit C
VSALVFRLGERPPQRLDLSPLTPERLEGRGAGEIERIELQTTRERACVGDIFRLSGSDIGDIRFEGGSDRFDRVGEGMGGGDILVDGDVGLEAGRAMRGGRLTIRGDAGPLAGSGLRGGRIEIGGDAGDRLGGPLPGEMTGMNRGTILVRGSAGDRAGDRMRRGLIVVEGGAGACLASRMIAGTIVVGGAAGALPGTLMARGTLVLCGGAESLSPTFVDCGETDLVAMRLLVRWLAAEGMREAAGPERRWRRLMGDTAGLGKGEIFLAPSE